MRVVLSHPPYLARGPSLSPPRRQGTGTQVSREVDTGCAVTALALPYGGRVLFAGTETGAVRGYRYPLTGEFYEVGAFGHREPQRHRHDIG